MKSYNRLMEKYREIALVKAIIGQMTWDLETYLPPRGLTLRSDQLDVLERVGHRLLTSQELAGLLSESEKGTDSLDEVQRRNLHLFRRERDIAMSVPEDLVAALASQSTIARGVWAKAKAAHDWSMFEPELAKLVDLSVKRAEATMHARGTSCVFDSLLDDYERGMAHDRVAELLAELRDLLVPLAEKFSNLSRETNKSILGRPVPVETQRKIARDLAGLIGYDTSSDSAFGRIDETEHPFTSGYFDDVRIAVHYYEDDLFNSVYSALHEGGHGMYQHNINHDWVYQPVGEAASFGIHEAMSRFAENMIGRSQDFWTYYLPRLNELTSGAFSDVQLVDLLRAINKVQPSKIRVTADEVTYSLHIVIRFEIEHRLFEGKLDVSELPQVWNELYDKYLHVKFDHDGEGVMQDVHWSAGSFGYWPSYVLGNIYGGMFLNKLDKEVGDWSDEVARGRPGAAMKWLRDNVHQWGNLYEPGTLVEKVTGTSLTVKPFVEYLTERHGSLWE